MDKLMKSTTAREEQQTNQQAENTSQRIPTTEALDTSSQADTNMRRPFFQDSGARQPSIIPKEGEEMLEKVKSKFLSLYRGICKNVPANFTPAQKKEFHSLKEDKDTIVHPRPTGGAISSPPLVFLRYLLNQCRYHHQTCSTLSPNIFTHCVKILKSRVL